MSEERLQKLLARAGVASRRKAEELIREGHVTINGRVAEIGDKADLERDSVKLDERRIHAPAGHRYLLLNKPRAVMSTVSDPAGRTTVIDLVPEAMRRALAPVGRLDYQTEGLLLLTDDGDLAQHVAHPSFGCWKTYEVKVRGRPAAEQLDRLRAGIVLEGRRTAPCRIAALPWASRAAPASIRASRAARRTRKGPVESTSSWWSVELGEGRSRQIREMFQRIGHPVQKLRRIAIGPVADPHLPVGSFRELSEREVAALRKAGPPPPPIPRKTPRAAPAAAPAGKSPRLLGAAPQDPGTSRPATRSPRPSTSAPKRRRAAPSGKPRRRDARGARPATPGGKRARAAAARGPAGGQAERRSRPPGARAKQGHSGGHAAPGRPGAARGAKRSERSGATRKSPPGGRPAKGRPGSHGGAPPPGTRPGRAAGSASSRPGRPGGRAPARAGRPAGTAPARSGRPQARPAPRPGRGRG